MNTPKYIINGQRSGILTGIRDAEPSVYKRSNGRLAKLRRIECLCDCGRTTFINLTAFKKGQQSCGCKRYEKFNYRKHLLSRHPLYQGWQRMIQRCYNTNSSSYHRYGLIGVRVCAEWKNNFLSYYNWAIKNGWKPGLRVDKDIKAIKKGHIPRLYSPDFCSIVTDRLNSNYKEDALIVIYNSERITLSELSQKINIPYSCLFSRYKQGDRGDKLIRPSLRKIKK